MLDKTLRLTRPLAVLDLEATGVDPRRDRVVEVAVRLVRPDAGVDDFHTLVNPGILVPVAATAVHGLADADVAAAPSFAAVADQLDSVLDGADLAGFGITTFDLPLLVAEFARCKRTFTVAGRHVIDALAVYRRYEPRDLASAVRLYLGEDHVRAHTATADAVAAGRVLARQVARYNLPASPAELHAHLVEVDVAGRFHRDGTGRVAFAFGKHVGRPLREVARSDAGYLRWMLDQAFLDDVTTLVRRALAGDRLDQD